MKFYIFDLLKCSSMDFFQTNEFINFFITLRRAEVIIWENFVLAKQDPGITKEGSHLAGMKLFTCNPRV